MNCKQIGCKSPAVEGGEYCGEHRAQWIVRDPAGTQTSPNTEQGAQACIHTESSAHTRSPTYLLKPAQRITLENDAASYPRLVGDTWRVVPDASDVPICLRRTCRHFFCSGRLGCRAGILQRWKFPPVGGCCLGDLFLDFFDDLGTLAINLLFMLPNLALLVAGAFVIEEFLKSRLPFWGTMTAVAAWTSFLVVYMAQEHSRETAAQVCELIVEPRFSSLIHHEGL